MSSGSREGNQAIEAFIASIGEGKTWAELWVKRKDQGFEVRHVADRFVSELELRQIAVGEVRKVVMFTAAGVFRPLRSSPDLQRGWLLQCSDAAELWRALQEIYPGSVPDWFAAQGVPPVTNYREFTGRQTGMYRITQLLTDEQAGIVARAACQERFCLKRRLWTVEGLAPDTPGQSAAPSGKSEIPCLEPCAILLELARKATRIEQEEKADVQLSRSEIESVLAAAEAALASGSSADRIGNLGDAGNPRRLQLLIEKLRKFAVPESGD